MMGMSKYYWVYPWDWGLLGISWRVFHDGYVQILLGVSMGLGITGYIMAGIP